MAEESPQQPLAFDERTQVFIVRIWLEPREIVGAGVEWRGVIEHVPTQERRYLNDLAALLPFITPYLDSMGVKRTRPGRLRRWLDAWKRQGKARS
jgi:hypothetical protein